LPSDPDDHRAFILANTKLSSPSLLPELRLHLAHSSLPLWQKTADDLGDMGLEPPYWAFAWAGGQALARYVLDHPHIVAGKTVLDIGSGSGLGAISAMRAGAGKAVAADIDCLAVAAIALNCEVNGVVLEVVCLDILASQPPPADVFLVGDLFYEQQLADKALAFILAAAAAGADVLVGDPSRSYFPRAHFEALEEYDVPVPRDLEDADVKRTAVWRLKSGAHAVTGA
jgi:predicted nicotinamide N-methyase